MIDPCIPRAWDGFKATRRFRNAWYAIEVENPQHVCRGVASLAVEGAHSEGNLVPIFDDGRTHRVIMVMGLNRSTNLHESPRI